MAKDFAPVYKDIRETRSNLELPVPLDGKEFVFPGLEVGDASTSVTIFLFDPRKPGLGEAAAKDLARLIPGNSLVMTAYSEKSVPMARKAVNLSLGLTAPLIVLERGTEAELKEKGCVTRACSKSIKKNEPVFLGLNPLQGGAIQKAWERGKTIVILDDVRSTGSTEMGMLGNLVLTIGKEILKPEYQDMYKELCEAIHAAAKEGTTCWINPEKISNRVQFVYVFEEFKLVEGQAIPDMPEHVQAVGRIPAIIKQRS